MQQLIDNLNSGVPGARVEVISLGRTLKKRAEDVLAYFDRPGTSNGPTEAINGRLEHLRDLALGLRNPTHYIARALLETGGFRSDPDYTVDCEEPAILHAEKLAPDQVGSNELVRALTARNDRNQWPATPIKPSRTGEALRRSGKH